MRRGACAATRSCQPRTISKPNSKGSADNRLHCAVRCRRNPQPLPARHSDGTIRPPVQFRRCSVIMSMTIKTPCLFDDRLGYQSLIPNGLKPDSGIMNAPIHPQWATASRAGSQLVKKGLRPLTVGHRRQPSCLATRSGLRHGTDSPLGPLAPRGTR